MIAFDEATHLGDCRLTLVQSLQVHLISYPVQDRNRSVSRIYLLIVYYSETTFNYTDNKSKRVV